MQSATGLTLDKQGAMGLREKIAANSKIVVSGLVTLIVIVAGYGFWTMSSDVPEGPLQAFYTSDDGKTYFADDAIKLVPFLKDGKEAVKANVYESPNGKRFVGSLERMSPEAKAIIEKYKAEGTTPDTPTQMKLAEGGTQMKLPGESKWVVQSEFNRTFKLKNPDGSTGAPRLVVP